MPGFIIYCNTFINVVFWIAQHLLTTKQTHHRCINLAFVWGKYAGHTWPQRRYLQVSEKIYLGEKSVVSALLYHNKHSSQGHYPFPWDINRYIEGLELALWWGRTQKVNSSVTGLYLSKSLAQAVIWVCVSVSPLDFIRERVRFKFLQNDIVRMSDTLRHLKQLPQN